MTFVRRVTFATQERVDVLKEKFDVLTDGMDNWKMPIDTVVPANELNDMRDACEFFTGSELFVVEPYLGSPFENKPMFQSHPIEGRTKCRQHHGAMEEMLQGISNM